MSVDTDEIAIGRISSGIYLSDSKCRDMVETQKLIISELQMELEQMKTFYEKKEQQFKEELTHQKEQQLQALRDYHFLEKTLTENFERQKEKLEQRLKFYNSRFLLDDEDDITKSCPEAKTNVELEVLIDFLE